MVRRGCVGPARSTSSANVSINFAILACQGQGGDSSQYFSSANDSAFARDDAPASVATKRSMAVDPGLRRRRAGGACAYWTSGETRRAGHWGPAHGHPTLGASPGLAPCLRSPRLNQRSGAGASLGFEGPRDDFVTATALSVAIKAPPRYRMPKL